MYVHIFTTFNKSYHLEQMYLLHTSLIISQKMHIMMLCWWKTILELINLRWTAENIINDLSIMTCDFNLWCKQLWLGGFREARVKYQKKSTRLSLWQIQTLSGISIGEKAAISSIDNTLDNFCQAAGANLRLKLEHLHYKGSQREAIYKGSQREAIFYLCQLAEVHNMGLQSKNISNTNSTRNPWEL